MGTRDDELRASNTSLLVSLDTVRGVSFSSSLSIGRHEENQLELDNPMVSSRHAVIEWDGGRWRLKDLGSSNGTTVNEKRVRGRKLLKEGDILRFAGVSRWKLEVLVPPERATGTGVTKLSSDRPGERDFRLVLTPVRPGEGRVRVVLPNGEWEVTTGQRFLLLYVLAGSPGTWIDDEDIKIRLWGKGGARGVDPSALHKLIYDTRQMFIAHETDGWFIQKAGGRTRIEIDADRVDITPLKPTAS